MRRALLSVLVFAGLAAPARAGLWTPMPAQLVKPPEMPRGDGVRAVVRRARITGAIAPADARRWRDDIVAARATLRRLTGARRAELASVFAALGHPTVSRMPLAFLTLERNTQLWRTRPFPAPGERMTFGHDPAVFQYFPGRGIQFHPLATAGKANALADHPQRFRALLDRLLALSSRRAGFTAWEYRFDFGGGLAPWISAMTQATAAQALARGYKTFGDERYRTAALSALGAFERPAPVGVALGHEYLMYSFSPGLHILNGFLQSVIGLHDVAELTGSRRAQRLYTLGERTARGMLADYDTGAWSRYSLDGREAPLSYHELITGFLDGLCRRTKLAAYCDTARRFTRYLHEPPRIGLDVPGRATQHHGTAFSVSVSKISSLSVTVTSAHGVAFHSGTTLPRGRLPFSWTPGHHGTYRVHVSAVGPEGLSAVRTATLRVRIDPAIVRARRERRAAKRRAARRRAARHDRRRADRPGRPSRARVRARH